MEQGEKFDKVLKQMAKKDQIIHDMVPKIGNNTINNNQKISINVFLNEKCSNAMNLTDFVEKLQITLGDLTYAAAHGSAKSISDKFIKQLKDMEPTERPIHCSDTKRLQFYVKEDNEWEKDIEHEKLDYSIKKIQSKQMDMLQEWTKKHPNWIHNDKESDIYIEMVNKVAWERAEQKKVTNKVKRSISKTIDIKEAMNDT